MADGIALGADGGGTKTHLCAVDRAGQLVGFASGGASNWEGVGAEGAAEVLADLVGKVLAQAGAQPGDVVGSAFCLAGVFLSVAIAAGAVIRLVIGCWCQSSCQRPAVGIS